MTREIELKLSIATQDIERLKLHPAIKAATTEKSKVQWLLSTYYDTPQLTLLDYNITLRVRHASGLWFQTIKSTEKSLTGLHQRMELEDIIAGGHPDFSKITDPALITIFDNKALRKAIRPIFSTKVQRTAWQLGFDNGDKLELALDIGELIVNENHEPISEIELELRDGNTGRLFDFALKLNQSIPFKLLHSSKSQRGYNYYRPTLLSIVRANPPHLKPTMSAHTALKKIVWECFAHLQGNQEVVLYRDDEEGVHQMRVALRRLRSTLSIFGSIINPKSCTDIINDLRWITGLLGRARDLDVFTKQTLASISQLYPNESSLIHLNIKAQRARSVAKSNVRKAIRSQRYQHMLLSIANWLESERWRENNSIECNALDIAKTMLAKRHKPFKQQGKHLMRAQQEERHAVRIASKKLRYATEFFAQLYPKGRLTHFLPVLSQLSDTLGHLNDISITQNITHKLMGSKPNSTLIKSSELLTRWNACNTKYQLKNLKRNWKQFERLKPRWD